MGDGDFVARWAGLAFGLLLCAVFAIHPAASEAAKKSRPSAKEQTAPRPIEPDSLSDPPPAENFKERVAWAGKEADRLRATLAGSPRDESARVLMASLAVVVTSDLERALAIGDIDYGVALRKLIERKLPDTHQSLGRIAHHGASGGYFALGVMAFHGILGQRDRDTACRLLASAWGKGFHGSAYRLSDCVAGNDPARETTLLEVAADAGHATASEQLGRRCFEARPQDTRCAFTRISAAAVAGRASAKSLLGWMYAQGIGVTADLPRAQSLYIAASNAGDLSAKNNLGELHETGRGVAVDSGRAAEYYREAAEAGFGPAQFNLGRLYAAGAGLPRDADKARTWLGAALKSGVRPAQKILDWLDTQAAPAR